MKTDSSRAPRTPGGAGQPPGNRLFRAVIALVASAAIAACGGGGDDGPPKRPLTGKLRAPVGAQVVLQNNGGDDLSISVPSAAASRYGEQNISFATPLADSDAYLVSVRTAPAGQTCSVYQGGAGTLTQALLLRVGCEWNTDLINRSASDSVLGSYFDGVSSEPVAIGGANVPIGATTTAYGEGRYVVYASGAGGLGASSGDARQIIWRDRQTGETVLVSINASGVPGNDGSFSPALSADGQTVVFESYATNLSPADTNGVRDVFVWSARNRGAGAVRISVGAGGVEGNAESSSPSVSGDGNWVAFETLADNIAEGNYTSGGSNIILLNRATGLRQLVSVGLNGQDAGGSGGSAISEDGSRVAFWSLASNLVAGDTNDIWDIFVYDRTSAQMRRVSVPAAGGERDQGNDSISGFERPAISGDGRYVAFPTSSNTLVPGGSNGNRQLYVVDLLTGGVVRASATAAGVIGNGDSPGSQTDAPSFSYDGTWIAFTTRATNLGPAFSGVVMRNLRTGETRLVSPATSNGVGDGPALSRSAAYIAFSAADVLDPRFDSTGVFARYTGLQRAWHWTSD